MLAQIDPRSAVPIWEQIVNQIKELVLKEMLSPGDKVPSVRETASLLLVNPNTVSKAYKELENQGIIETLRGRGTFVRENLKLTFDEERISLLREKVRQVVIEGSYIGVKVEDINQWLLEIQAELGGKIHD
ncbi:MAG: GntR family transcriptional regulator [Turicibacter sp.]|nr:GntR family transcriptional regulator [Turicibacter sp.]